MFGRVFILVMLACLAMLSFHETVRYRRAAREPEGVPYPRRRLIRRLTVAVLLGAMLAICLCWPERAAVSLRFALTGVLLLLLTIGMALIVRDLHETSRAVAALHSEMNRKAALELERLFAIQARAGAKDRDNRPPRPGDGPGDPGQ